MIWIRAPDFTMFFWPRFDWSRLRAWKPTRLTPPKLQKMQLNFTSQRPLIKVLQRPGTERWWPEDISHGSGRKSWWLCAKGHEWEATISSRQRNGCPYCSNLYVSEGSSLLDFNPTVCLEWDYEKNDTKPYDYNPKSGKKVWWRCTKGEDHVWEARIASRAAPEDGILSGCPFCAGRKPSKRYNLAVVHPELLSEWDYTKNTKPPEKYVPKSNYTVW